MQTANVMETELGEKENDFVAGKTPSLIQDNGTAPHIPGLFI
jgi:hypothetical protein